VFGDRRIIDVEGAVTGRVSIVALISGNRNSIFPGSAERVVLVQRNELVGLCKRREEGKRQRGRGRGGEAEGE